MYCNTAQMEKLRIQQLPFGRIVLYLKALGLTVKVGQNCSNKANGFHLMYLVHIAWSTHV